MRNAIGQPIRVGDIVTHTTASHYADLSLGFVRGFVDLGNNWAGNHLYKVQVTWIFQHGSLSRHPVKTSVMLNTLTRVLRGTLDVDIQDRLSETMTEHFGSEHDARILSFQEM